MKKVFVVGRGIGYARWIENAELVSNIEDADIVLFTGGEDVNPALYNEEVHETTYFTPERDSYEVSAYSAMRPDQFALGICRGLQLLNVLQGGKLIQNVRHHGIGGTHEIHDKGGNTYEITSLHHQMVYPWTINSEYFDILYSCERRSSVYEGLPTANLEYFDEYGEPEVVYYHAPDAPKCLGIQGHPEMMNRNSYTVKMLNNLLDTLCQK